MSRSGHLLLALTLSALLSLFAVESSLAQGKGTGTTAAQPVEQGGKKKPKPPKPALCKNIERPCADPGNAQFCSCKDGVVMKTVTCGCRGVPATSGPATGGSQGPFGNPRPRP